MAISDRINQMKATLSQIPFLIILLLSTTALFAQEEAFQLDPSQSQVSWTLGDVLHTVHGTFHLKSGVLRFDPKTGVASGELVVDATSGKSGNDTRDGKMKKDILEAAKFPNIVFAPQHVTGSVAQSGGSQVQLQGTMTLHGESHPMTIVVPLQVNGNQASADVHFVVPYVDWGLKNPSTLFLRVSKTVDIDVHAVGTMATQPGPAPSR
jgi:polyisoprenoid-binding protein YceI